MYPAAGHDLRQGCGRKAAPGALRQCRKLKRRMRGERGIQRAQEKIAVEGVMLPGVLAVESNQDRMAGRTAQLFGEGCELASKIRRRILTTPKSELVKDTPKKSAKPTHKKRK